MYLRDLVAGLRRRWYVVIAGLLLTGLGAWAVFTLVPVSYLARASVMLMPPDNATPDGGNPFLNLSGMAPARDVLTRRVDADVVRLPIEDAYPDAEYIVYADSTTSGPMILADVEDPDEAEALEVLALLREQLVTQLDQMQNELGVPPSAHIQLTEVAIDREPEPDSSSRLQLTVGAVAAGIVLTVLITGFVDGMVMARRSRRSGTTETSAAGSPAPLPLATEPGAVDEHSAEPSGPRDGALTR